MIDGARVALWDLADDAGRALANELGSEDGLALYQRCDMSSAAPVQASTAKNLEVLG